MNYYSKVKDRVTLHEDEWAAKSEAEDETAKEKAVQNYSDTIEYGFLSPIAIAKHVNPYTYSYDYSLQPSTELKPEFQLAIAAFFAEFLSDVHQSHKDFFCSAASVRKFKDQMRMIFDKGK